MSQEQTRARTRTPLLILVAGVYQSGTGDDPEKIVRNMRFMSEAALATSHAGHLARLTVTIKAGERAGGMAAQRDRPTRFFGLA